VALVDADPFGGAIDLDRMRRATPTGEPLGLVTGATRNRVRGAITTVFAP
jgi:phage protein U